MHQPPPAHHSEHPAITMCVHYNLILICAVVLLAITSVQTYCLPSAPPPPPHPHLAPSAFSSYGMLLPGCLLSYLHITQLICNNVFIQTVYADINESPLCLCNITPT